MARSPSQNRKIAGRIKYIAAFPLIAKAAFDRLEQTAVLNSVF